MIRVIIIFAPDEKNILDVANTIKDAFKKKKCQAEARAANASSITDIAASEIVVLGSNDPGKKTIHADFSEISRAIQGINLAGRTAGIISFGKEDKFPVFKKILHDSDITVYDKQLVIEDRKSAPGTIAGWVDDILKTYEGHRR